MMGFWLFGSLNLSVISLDTFVGVIVALLAIVFTVGVGLQIVNAIEIREKMAEIEKQQQKHVEIEQLLASNDQLRNKQIYNLQAGLCGQSADLYLAKNQYIEAFGSYHAALCYAIKAEQSGQLERINQLRGIIQVITNRPVVDFSIIARQIKLDSEEIRNTESYKRCLSSTYEQTMQEFWKKMSLLGLN
jgi:hypothetical protein